MTDKPKWPNYKRFGNTWINKTIIDQYKSEEIWDAGYNAAIDKCNACVQGITEEEIEKIILDETKHGFVIYPIRWERIVSAAIVKHIKERLS